MNRNILTGKTRVQDLRTQINPYRLKPLFSKLGTHYAQKVQKAYIETFEVPLQAQRFDAMYMKCIELFIANDEKIRAVRVQPMRFYGVPNEKVNITWELPLDGVLCVARENLYGGVFSNLDLRRELVPVELITIAKRDKNRISDIEIINGHDDAFLDLILFSLQP